MTTYSTNLGLTLIGVGEEDGTWGPTTNTNLGTLLEQAISGYVTYACTGGDDTITIPDGADGVARNMYIELTGTGGGNLIVPSNKKLYFIYNNTTSGSVTIKVDGQTGYTLPNGYKVALVSNGTDVSPAINYIPLTLITTSILEVLDYATFGNYVTVGDYVTIGGFKLSASSSTLSFSSTVTYTASISLTTMTVTASTVGYVINGQEISGTGVTAGTTVVGQLTSTETAAASPTYSSGGAIGDSSFVVSSSTGIAKGQMISGTGVPTGTYVLRTYGNTVYLCDYSGSPVTFTIQAAGTYNFKPARGKGTYTVSTSQTVSSTTISAVSTVATLDSTGNFTALGIVSSNSALA